jgi:predicted MPP superfamily phosphohydrolase
VSRRIVIGDIHGCYKTLKKLTEEKLKITPSDHLYFIGDYIDRGPASQQVLDYLIELKWQSYNIYPIRGNHEEMLLKAISDNKFIHAWYNNGAEETLKSFDIPDNLLFEYDGIKLIPEKYIHFISNLPYFIVLDDYIIVHAGLNFKLDQPFDDKESMLWMRNINYDAIKAENKKIIHGHTPMPSVSILSDLRDKQNKVINIDSGCVYKDLPGYGKLMAYDLDSGETFFEEYAEG